MKLPAQPGIIFMLLRIGRKTFVGVPFIHRGTCQAGQPLSFTSAASLQKGNRHHTPGILDDTAYGTGPADAAGDGLFHTGNSGEIRIHGPFPSVAGDEIGHAADSGGSQEDAEDPDKPASAKFGYTTKKLNPPNVLSVSIFRMAFRDVEKK